MDGLPLVELNPTPTGAGLWTDHQLSPAEAVRLIYPADIRVTKYHFVFPQQAHNAKGFFGTALLNATGAQAPATPPGTAARALVAFCHRVHNSDGADIPPHWPATDARFIPKMSGKEERTLHLLGPAGAVYFDALLQHWEPHNDPKHTGLKEEQEAEIPSSK